MAKPIPKPFNPQPARPGLRVRLRDGGPYVDLGISYSELLIGILNTLDLICVQTGAGMDDRIRTALDKLKVHQGGSP